MAQHTVQKGDTLSSIAQLYYGDATPESIKKIFEANKGVKGVGPTENDLHYEVAPFDSKGKGQPVVLEIPD
jgi:nucleoid-associated protein YgaU